MNTLQEHLAGREAALARDIRRHFPADCDAAIVDVGCGFGILVLVARRLGYRNISGIDACLDRVESGRRFGIEGLEHADGLAFLRRTPTASLDVLIFYDVLEHFDRSNIIAAVAEAHRVLRPGGRCTIHAPNGESPFCGAVRYGDLTHEIAFTRQSMDGLLSDAGFHPIAFFEDSPAIHGARSLIRSFAWRMLSALLRLAALVETGEGASIVSRNFLTVAHRSTCRE